jgi:uncharacterized membrane protein
MKTSQSKKGSIIESIVNTAVGLVITIIFSPLIYWICDVKISYPQMGLATILFTVLSIARNYVIRRFFNKQKL